MASARLTRQEFLRIGGGLASGALLLSSCDLLSTKPGGDDGRQGNSGQQKKNGPEAPQLAQQVEDGELPPVKTRLPKNPLVLQPIDRVGTYGGTWNSYMLGATDTPILGRTFYDRLVHWDPVWNEIVPNLAESFEVNDEGTEYTFTLREGLKWSNGEPFTVDDIVFWYEDVFMNKELTPAYAFYLTSGSDLNPVSIEKLDEHRFRFVYQEPNGQLLHWLATYDTSFKELPAHYLKQFHKKYNPEADALAKKENLSDWVDLFFAKADWWANPELPRMHAWTPTGAVGEGSAGRVEFVRNPYYFKVDPEGSQLPYIDRVVFSIFTEEEPMLLSASGGDIDLTFRTINTSNNKPVFARSREQGEFEFFDMEPSQLNTTWITLNLNHQDPVKREIFRNRDFRIGLSYAIDRAEIIKSVYQRQGEPWQIAPRPNAPYWDDGGEMAKQYTEYDPKEANRYLDRAGYAKRNPEGIRLGPDGKPITFIMLTKTFYFGMVDTMEMVRKFWREAGVDMRIRAAEDSYFEATTEANRHDGAVDTGDIGYKDVLIDPRCFIPGFLQGAFWAMLWYRWFVGDPGDKEEPPPPMLKQMELYRQTLRSKVSTDEQYDVMAQILQISKEQFWNMGIALPPIGYGTVTNRLKNVPAKMWDAFRWPTPGPTNPPQYFLTD
jgi:peptide/nickel transport system substrate-binding protein